MSYGTRDDLAGIGGWLAFFVATLAVIGPIAGALGTVGNLYGNPQVATFFGRNWPTVQFLEWSVFAAGVAISWFVAWRLVRVRVWKSVRIAVAGLWAMAILPGLAEMVGISLISGMSVGSIAAGMGAQALRPLIYAAVWTAYLLRSVRVQNTYAYDADESELAAVFE